MSVPILYNCPEWDGSSDIQTHAMKVFMGGNLHSELYLDARRQLVQVMEQRHHMGITWYASSRTTHSGPTNF